ncbi:DUF3293 domain-containing protein [Castellaniella sp.]|uniref:DUF3293 domain-containing protein n=1 Tax=Castellaniella sp. TaxID=1955812 RepID=UPI0025C501C7|nr:DUF3293 domain-containing protein [Castellaniella sp.]
MGASCPDGLAQAYRHALYRIDTPTPIVLRIGATHPELKVLAATLGQPEWGAFLSASNPHSRILRPAANNRRLAALQRALKSSGHLWLPGQGLDPLGQWPAEPSLWIAGLTEADARTLALRFRQNAFVWCDAHTVAHLVWTRQIQDSVHPFC